MIVKKDKYSLKSSGESFRSMISETDWGLEFLPP